MPQDPWHGWRRRSRADAWEAGILQKTDSRQAPINEHSLRLFLIGDIVLRGEAAESQASVEIVAEGA